MEMRWLLVGVAVVVIVMLYVQDIDCYQDFVPITSTIYNKRDAGYINEIWDEDLMLFNNKDAMKLAGSWDGAITKSTVC